MEITKETNEEYNEYYCKISSDYFKLKVEFKRENDYRKYIIRHEDWIELIEPIKIWLKYNSDLVSKYKTKKYEKNKIRN